MRIWDVLGPQCLPLFFIAHSASGELKAGADLTFPYHRLAPARVTADLVMMPVWPSVCE